MASDRQVANSWWSTAGRALGVSLRPHAAGEACGPCPRCQGDDRFVVFEDGNYWCRRCHFSGWWLPDVEGARRAAAESRVTQQQRAARLVEQMAGCRDWLDYHKAALANARWLDLWATHGITEATVRHFGLGYCPSAPLYPTSASLTIPVFTRGVLVDIRHRLLSAPPESGKYRSHVAGLPLSAYNLDAVLAAEAVLIVEGEKKAAVLHQAGWPATIGIPSKTFAKRGAQQVAERMDTAQVAIIGMDPDAQAEARDLAGVLRWYKFRVLIADFPLKPDDVVQMCGPEAVRAVLRQARVVH